MDFQEFEERETEIENRLIRELAGKDLSEISLKNFYPEFQFSEVYGLQAEGVPISTYLIPYERIIVKVPPMATEKEFKRHHGLTLPEMVEFVKMGKLLPLICFPYQEYPQYYAPLFKVGHFPRTGRVRAFLASLCPTNLDRLQYQLYQIGQNTDFRGRVKELFGGYSGDKKKLFLDSFVSDLTDLEILGFSEIVNMILDIIEYEPNLAHEICFDYVKLLSMPLIEGLEGYYSFTNHDVERAKRLHLHTERIKAKVLKHPAKEKLLNRIENFYGLNPEQLVYFMNQQIRVEAPEKVENKIGYLESLEKNDQVKALRQKLSEIRREHKTIEGLLIECQQIAQEVKRSVESDLKKMQTMSSWTAPILLIGAILPAISGQLIVKGNTLAELFFIVLGDLIKTQYRQVEEFTKTFIGSAFQKLIKRPIPAVYWKRQIAPTSARF